MYHSPFYFLALLIYVELYPEEVGSIHIDELSAPFDGENRPSIGSVFEAKVLNQKFDNRTQRNLWMLTMNISEALCGASQVIHVQGPAE